MGLFSGSTKIFVASSAYNLAGDIQDRSDYLKTTVVGTIMSPDNLSMGELIPHSYLNGPGIRMRKFARWARDNYEDTVGAVYGILNTVGALNNSLIAENIPIPSNQHPVIQSSELGYGDFSFWVDQWMLLNRPGRLTEEWESDYVDGVITITYSDETTDSFTPVDYDTGSLYLYVSYNAVSNLNIGPVVTGDDNEIPPDEDYPSTSGWTVTSESITSVPVELSTEIKTVTTWADNRPPVEDIQTSSTTINVDTLVAEYTRNEYLGILPGDISLTSRDYFMHFATTLEGLLQDESEEIIISDDGGVEKTETITTTTDVPDVKRVWRVDTRDTTTGVTGPLRLYIYKQGTGNAELDSLFEVQNTGDKFYPFIPIKLGTWVTGPTRERATRALKKATGGDMDKIITELNKNASIGSIQYIYGMFGCSLNAPENTAKEYIFRFFQLMLESSPPDPTYPTMDKWRAAWYAADAAEKEWDFWHASQFDTDSPYYGNPEPTRIPFPALPRKSFRIRSNRMPYDISVSWNMIDYETGSGVLWEGAKTGLLRIRNLGTEVLPKRTVSSDAGGSITITKKTTTIDHMILEWQVSPNQWKRINVYGATHANHVYDGKYVDIGSAEALTDSEESGFIIPLHEDVFKSMSLIRSTQLATASNYLMLNSYKKVKRKWYQTGAFQIVLIVVIVVISVFYPPTGAASGGVLGTNVAVGTALGFAGTAALIVGAIANAIAAMLIATIIQEASSALFGEKIGAIIGAIASVIAIQAGTALSTGQSMSSMMGQMMRADNLLKLTSTMGNAMSQYINAGTVELMRKTEHMMQSYNDEMSSLQKKYEEEFGYNNGTINPLSLTDAFMLASEDRESFLARTLLTGSEIAEMSHSMISNFTEVTLTLDR